MEELIEGYRKFRAEVWPQERNQYGALARRGQQPKALVIACSDSRVDPQTVFGAGPGELYVVRNVAGLVPPYLPDGGHHGVSAALEFAVRVLRVPNIIILGHAQCGGIKALVEGAPREARDFLDAWMDIAEPALASTPAGDRMLDILDHYEEEVVRLSLANLRTFPWIEQALVSGRLALHGFRFDICSGVLSRLRDGEFDAVD